MAKIAIKSEKLTPFGGIFSIMEQLLSVFSVVCGGLLSEDRMNTIYVCLSIVWTLLKMGTLYIGIRSLYKDRK